MKVKNFFRPPWNVPWVPANTIKREILAESISSTKKYFNNLLGVAKKILKLAQ